MDKLLNSLMEIVKQKKNADLKKIRKAYYIAQQAHKDQKRLSGEPFLIHPVEVSKTIASLNLDDNAIIAGLLHDVVEDTGFTSEYIANEFGQEVSDLVDGVTKISKLKAGANSIALSIRKMLTATIKDVRVIIIKLCDKLHNMSTIQYQPPHKRKRIAKETLEIYAPLADRFGMARIKAQLEDYSFYILFPEEFKELYSEVGIIRDKFNLYLIEIEKKIGIAIDKSNINAVVYGRTKHLYSIYRKMREKKRDLDEIYDICAVRIITDDIKSCYAILGVVHSIWNPMPGRFKDFIATPKPNLYQSLHTTVLGLDNFPLEIQIRSWWMDKIAEEGISAHWMYKEDVKVEEKLIQRFSFLKDLSKLHDDVKDPSEYLEELKLNLDSDKIFVYTPKREIIELMKGYTVLDFAFRIHTEVGYHCTGAKINGRIVPLDTQPQNGDVIEIITNKNAKPSRNWVKIVKSKRVKSRIKHYLKTLSKEGQEEIKQSQEEAEKNKEIEQKRKERSVDEELKEMIDRINVKKDKKLPTTVPIGLSSGNNGNKNKDQVNVMMRKANCCNPIPYDDIVGFITRGKGITIHKRGCPNIVNLENDRLIEVSWDTSENDRARVKIEIRTLNNSHLIKDIINILSLNNANIIEMQSLLKENKIKTNKFILEVEDTFHLEKIFNKINKLKGVLSVVKLKGKVSLAK